MSGVQFKRVTKRYDGDVVAVESMDLEIEDREFLVLLGPSGCGKSTALRMIAGLESISDGELLIGDRVVNDMPASERDIAMVFQSYALYPHMTVRRNIESPLVARKVHEDGVERKLGKAERDARVLEAATILGLEQYLDRKPGALSGGQRQRVALARAIVRRPEVFLMDEPLSNLDAKLRTQTRAELVELHRRLGITFVYVTHDQVEAMTMATRVAVMSMGRLQQVGTPQAVYERPANLFVAGFIGSPPMNTLPGRLTATGATATAELAGGIWRVGSAGSAADGEVIVGVRPEHLHRTTDDSGVPAVVDVVEQLGHERHLLCRIGDSRVVVREGQDGSPPQPAEEIRLEADPAHVHLFDPGTTERVN